MTTPEAEPTMLEKLTALASSALKESDTKRLSKIAAQVLEITDNEKALQELYPKENHTSKEA